MPDPAARLAWGEVSSKLRAGGLGQLQVPGHCVPCDACPAISTWQEGHVGAARETCRTCASVPHLLVLTGPLFPWHPQEAGLVLPLTGKQQAQSGETDTLAVLVHQGLERLQLQEPEGVWPALPNHLPQHSVQLGVSLGGPAALACSCPGRGLGLGGLPGGTCGCSW